MGAKLNWITSLYLWSKHALMVAILPNFKPLTNFSEIKLSKDDTISTYDMKIGTDMNFYLSFAFFENIRENRGAKYFVLFRF